MPIRPEDFDTLPATAAEAQPPLVVHSVEPNNDASIAGLGQTALGDNNRSINGSHSLLVPLTLTAAVIFICVGIAALMFLMPSSQRITAWIQQSVLSHQAVPVQPPRPGIQPTRVPDSGDHKLQSPTSPGEASGVDGVAPKGSPDKSTTPATTSPTGARNPEAATGLARNNSASDRQSRPDRKPVRTQVTNQRPNSASSNGAEQAVTEPARQSLQTIDPPVNRAPIGAVESAQSQLPAVNGNVSHPVIAANSQPLPYSGPSSGTLTWQGEVDGTALLVIQNGQPSFGTIAGAPLPGVLCMLQISDPKHFSVAVAPAPSNQWKKVVLNVHGKGVMNVKLTWALP